MDRYETTTSSVGFENPEGHGGPVPLILGTSLSPRQRRPRVIGPAPVPHRTVWTLHPLDGTRRAIDIVLSLKPLYTFTLGYNASGERVGHGEPDTRIDSPMYSSDYTDQALLHIFTHLEERPASVATVLPVVTKHFGFELVDAAIELSLLCNPSVSNEIQLKIQLQRRRYGESIPWVLAGLPKGDYVRACLNKYLARVDRSMNELDFRTPVFHMESFARACSGEVKRGLRNNYVHIRSSPWIGLNQTHEDQSVGDVRWQLLEEADTYIRGFAKENCTVVNGMEWRDGEAVVAAAFAGDNSRRVSPAGLSILSAAHNRRRGRRREANNTSAQFRDGQGELQLSIASAFKHGSAKPRYQSEKYNNTAQVTAIREQNLRMTQAGR